MALPWLPILRTLLPVALLAGLVAYADPGRLYQAVLQARPGWVLLSCALGVTGVALQWWKWRALSHWLPRPLPAAQITNSLFGGFALGLVSPGRLGELGRAVFVRGQRRQVTVLTAVDRSLSGLVTLAAGLLALIVLAPAWREELFLAILCLGGLALITRRRWWHRRLRQRLVRLQGIGSGHWNPVQLNLAGAVAFNLLFFTQMFCLLRAGGDVPETAMIAIPLVFAAKTILPLAPMDLGVREGAAVLILSPFGVDAAVALQASLLLFAINVLSPGVAGWLLIGLTKGRPLPGIVPSPHRLPAL